MKHTPASANEVLKLLKSTVDNGAELIGSLARGVKESKHDIDILLPNRRRSQRTINRLKQLLKASSYEFTDWGGVYYRGTSWGNVDIFFKRPS